MKKTIHIIALIVCIIGVIMFLLAACGGTVIGTKLHTYEGLDGQSKGWIDAQKDTDWMGVPGLLMAIGGGIVYVGTKEDKE